MLLLDTLIAVRMVFVLVIFQTAFVMNSVTTLMTAAVMSLTFALSVNAMHLINHQSDDMFRLTLQ